MKLHTLVCGCAFSLLIVIGTFRSSAQTLSVTNGLQLWLRADAGVTTNVTGGVTQWNDQSGNGNHATQPTNSQAPLLVNNALTNRPALRFDGVDDFLDVADADSISFTGDMASFFVIKFDDFATFRAVWGKTAGTNNNLPAPTDLYGLPNDGRLRVFRGNGAGGGTPVNTSVTSDQPLAANAYFAVGFDVAGETLTHYLNNQVNGSGTSTTNTADGNTNLKIGTRSDFVTRLKGDLAELLIYNRAISSLERSNVFNYLRTKYALNRPPSVSLTATPAGPNVNVGDAVTLNATASDSDGTISRVEFLANNVVLGTAAFPPYSIRAIIESAGSVQFSARAFDNANASSNSAPVSLVAGPATSTNLTVTTGLQLWLKADAGISVNTTNGVTQWADQSGNNNHALQTSDAFSPILTNGAVNGRPALRFDGTDDFLEVADSDGLSIVGDISSFFVVRFTDFAGFRAIWGKSTLNFPAPNDVYAISGNGRIRFYRGNGSNAGLAPSDSLQPLATNTFLQAGFDMAGTTVRHYYNGLANGSGTLIANIVDGNGSLRVGSRADGGTRMRGEMAELLIYDRALSVSERRGVERYLADKYGLPPLLGVTNPPPAVAITGPVGTLFQAPGVVAVAASASDDGSIVSVQLFANGAPISTNVSLPYATLLPLTYGGPVVLSAVATDNLGAQSTSVPVQICSQGPGAPTGLVGYWPLDGNAIASVGTSGIMISNPVVTADRNGVAGGALFFAGTNQARVEIPGGGGLNGSARGTISMWVKWIGMQDGGVGNSFGAVLARQQDGAFSDNIICLNNADPDNATVQWRQATFNTINASNSAVVGNDAWRHIAVTFTESNSVLFVDGFPENTGTAGALHANPATPLAIGAWPGGGGSFATAAIDDVAIWSRALRPEEIEFIAGQTSTPTNLLISPDCLTVAPSGTNALVQWKSGTVLQQALQVSGPYQDVSGATNPYTTVVTNNARFFRLRSR